MSRGLGWVLMTLGLLSLAGCASGSSTDTQSVESKAKEHAGLIVGGLGGAAAGGLIAAALHANPAGIAAGVLLGGGTGGFIGHLVDGYRLDDKDKELATQASYKALESTQSGVPVHWRNPESGHEGSVVTTRTYQSASGQYCREFRQTVVLEGRPVASYETGCRQPDGNWKLMAAEP
jgi:surface antigen